MRISDWSSDVCSSDLPLVIPAKAGIQSSSRSGGPPRLPARVGVTRRSGAAFASTLLAPLPPRPLRRRLQQQRRLALHQQIGRHTSELQSLMRISYAVFCLKKKKKYTIIPHIKPHHQPTMPITHQYTHQSLTNPNTRHTQ